MSTGTVPLDAARHSETVMSCDFAPNGQKLYYMFRARVSTMYKRVASVFSIVV